MAKRGRRPNEVPSVRMSLGEGNITLGADKEMDALFYKLQELPRGQKFRTVCAWLISGARMETLLPQDELDEIKQAVGNIIDNFVS